MVIIMHYSVVLDFFFWCLAGSGSCLYTHLTNGGFVSPTPPGAGARWLAPIYLGGGVWGLPEGLPGRAGRAGAARRLGLGGDLPGS